MKRECLSFLSAAALAVFLSPTAQAQSAQGSMNAQGNNNWNQSQSRHANSAGSNWNSKAENDNNGNAAGEKKEASQMVPAHASLEKTIDAKNCHTGEQIRAKLGEKVQLKNGLELPEGTVLIGRITQDRTQPDNVKLALRFTQAKLSNGSSVPIKAMVVAIARPRAAAYYSNPRTPARDLWNQHTYQVDQLGAVSGADLHSKINSKNSAVISSDKKNDVKIDSGSRLDMAIAQQPQWNQGSRNNSSSPSM